MQKSTNYQFNMPEPADYVDISQISQAIGAIDGEIKAREDEEKAHAGRAAIHREITWQTITLTQGGWNSGTKQQTVAVPGITVSGDGLVKPFPVAGESQTLWSENSVKALPLQADGQLIFACESVPEGNISVIVEVVK